MCGACAAAEHPRWPFPLLMIRDPAQVIDLYKCG